MCYDKTNCHRTKGDTQVTQAFGEQVNLSRAGTTEIKSEGKHTQGKGQESRFEIKQEIYKRKKTQEVK